MISQDSSVTVTCTAPTLTKFNKQQVIDTNLTSEPAQYYEMLTETKEDDWQDRELVNKWASALRKKGTGFAVVLEPVPGFKYGIIRFYVEGQRSMAVHWVKADGKAIKRRASVRA